MSEATDRLQNLFADLASLQKAQSILSWDRQVMMPVGGAAARTEVLSRLARLSHEILTGDELTTAISLAKLDAESEEKAAAIRALERDVQIASRTPVELVIQKSKVSNDAYEVWKSAKSENNFLVLQPYVRELFDIARSMAESLGYTDHVYDPLVDLYEEGASYQSVKAMFSSIQQPVIDLVRRIKDSGQNFDDTLLVREWDRDKLRQFAQATAERIGFDFNRGRLDISANAFCSSSSCHDVRLTTRASNHLKGILSSSLHEMGHGLYEQNIAERFDSTPLAGGVSLAVHESQSRLWENIIGRSEAFWQFFAPLLHRSFPELNSIDGRQMSRLLSRVEPTDIRVGSDELTYNLHILIRFELEVELLTRSLEISDLPEAWNQKYESYLGIRPKSDATGCLQDVHWSRGSIGYFPTYSMGNLIGAQIWKSLEQQLGPPDQMISRGEFASILNWLKDNVYVWGRVFSPTELVQRITGQPMAPDAWLQYAQSKYTGLYGLS